MTALFFSNLAINLNHARAKFMAESLWKSYTKQVVRPIRDRIAFARANRCEHEAALATKMLESAESEIETGGPGALAKAHTYVTGAAEALRMKKPGSFAHQAAVNGMTDVDAAEVVRASERRPVDVDAGDPPGKPIRGSYVVRGSARWAAAVHEIGHVAVIFGEHVNRPHYVHSALVRDDGTGAVRFAHSALFTPIEDDRINVAGWAAQWLFAIDFDRGVEDDLSRMNRTRGDGLYGLRKSVEAELRARYQFVSKAADALYLAGELTGEQLEKLWNQYL